MATGRLHGASGEAWLDGEDEDDGAELGDGSDALEGRGGYGYDERWRRRVRAVGRERTRGGGRARESERGAGVRGVARVIQATRGRSRRWPGAWPRPAVARARSCLGEGEEDDRGGGGLGCCWAAQ